MRAVAIPPKLPISLGKIMPRMHESALVEFIAKANGEYYHWDELRHRPPPLDLTSEEAWAAVKISRVMAARRALPLTDVKGAPFLYWLPERAIRILHEIDRRGGGTLAASSEEPAIFEEMKDRVLLDSLMDEAIATSQIEGAVTTRRVAKDLLRTGRKPTDRSEQMIVNGYRTIRLLCEKRDTPLSVELLHEIQESMTRDTLDDAAHVGHFRTDDTVVVVDGRDNEVVFTPPPAAKLEMRMKRLVEFANEAPESEPFVHPLVRAAILHFWLAYEHPYADGNGRTARALFYWSMLKSGYWLFEYLTISRIIHAAPMQYYRSFLYAEQDDNDLTYFLMFQLDVTQKALADLHRRLHALSESQQRMKSIQLAAALNSRQRDLLDHALRHPNQVYTFESHQGTFGVTYQTARTDLLDLAARGLLVETGSRKPRKFLPAPELPRKLRAPKARRT